MKKIIELAQIFPSMCVQTWSYDKETGRELAQALEKRLALEQTPITEEWLKEHGWTCLTKDFYGEPSDKLSIAYTKGNAYEEKGWSIACTRIHLRSLADLYDALELCDIQID